MKVTRLRPNRYLYYNFQPALSVIISETTSAVPTLSITALTLTEKIMTAPTTTPDVPDIPTVKNIPNVNINLNTNKELFDYSSSDSQCSSNLQISKAREDEFGFIYNGDFSWIYLHEFRNDVWIRETENRRGQRMTTFIANLSTKIGRLKIRKRFSIISNNLTLRCLMCQIGAFRPFRRDCGRLRDRIMS